MNIYTYICINIYTHTYIHIYINIYTDRHRHARCQCYISELSQCDTVPRHRRLQQENPCHRARGQQCVLDRQIHRVCPLERPHPRDRDTGVYTFTRAGAVVGIQKVICASCAEDELSAKPHCANTLTSHRATRALAVGPGSSLINISSISRTNSNLPSPCIYPECDKTRLFPSHSTVRNKNNFSSPSAPLFVILKSQRLDRFLYLKRFN